MEAREKLQLLIAVTLVALIISIPAFYVLDKGVGGDDSLVKTIVTGSWTLLIAGAGAAFSLFGLGRKVSG